MSHEKLVNAMCIVYVTQEVSKCFNNNNTNTNTTELVWRPLQTKFVQGRLTIKNKIKITK